MPSIRSRQVACAEWPDIRRFEHFLQLLDIVNDAFNIHPSQYLTEKRPRSIRSSTLDTATAQFRPDPIRRRPVEGVALLRVFPRIAGSWSVAIEGCSLG